MKPLHSLALAAGLALRAHAAGPPDAPAFTLAHWKDPGEVRLADFAGKIVVLDFFAYWCVPCQKASAEIESRIRRHYLANRGNPAGIEVEVLAVNVEADQPAKTDAFIRRAQLHRVVRDPQGKTLEAYGGRNLPFIVVIDGTAATPDRPAFRIVHRREGFAGADKLRAVIDAIGRERPRSSLEPARRRDTLRDRLEALRFRPDPGLVGTPGEAEAAGPARLVSRRPGSPADRAVSPGADSNRRVVRRADPLLAMVGESGLLMAAAEEENDAEPGREEERKDAVAPGRTADPGLDGEGEVAGGGNLTHASSAGFDGALASDVQLTQSTFSHTIRAPTWEVSMTGGFATLGMDYQPVAFDFLGMPSRVDETRGFGQLGGRWRGWNRLEILGAAGLYEGFTDYRSAWLSEYYRQQFGALPGYVAPSPAGHNVTVGARWEYLPASGFAQLDYSYLTDEIAPGYEIDFDGLRRGRSYLHTHVFQVRLENVVHRRLRVLHEFRRSDTSDRELRYGYQGSANVALGERWVVRIQGGASTERPTFDAWYAGATVEYELRPSWLMSLTGRYYEDTGEIENSNFSNAAPPLSAWQIGVGVRYVREPYAVKLFAAPYATRYGPFGIGTAFFGNLYTDRDWGLVQAAFEMEF